MRPHVTCKGTSEKHVKQKKDGLRLCNAEEDLPKVNSTVVFLIQFFNQGPAYKKEEPDPNLISKK